MILVDGHLDIAFNTVCFGRDVRRSALAIRAEENEGPPQEWRGDCMVGLPEMRAARVAVVFGTLFAPRSQDWKEPGLDPELAYSDAAGAEKIALRQLDVYREITEPEQGFRFIRTVADLADVLAGWKDGATGDVGVVVLMEGADPIRTPDDAGLWQERGARFVGLSWRGTRYAGGTGEPGPLTPAGEKLVPELARAGLVLDLSHAADESARGALDLYEGTVIASHSNPRAVCDRDRQIPDDLIRAIGRRDGVIGIVPFNKMLVADWKASAGEVPLSVVAKCADHVAQVTGTHRTVAIGSDLDGGFGAESAPTGLDTIADLPRIADELTRFDFTDAQIEDVLGGNWLRILRRVLPGDDAR